MPTIGLVEIPLRFERWLFGKATTDGYDVQMQTNHLSHFLLTKELLRVKTSLGWRMADGGRKTLVLKSCFDLGWTIGRWTLTRIPNGRILRIFHSSRSCRVTNSSIHFHPLFSRGSIQHSILSSFSLPVAPTVPRLFPLLEKGDPDSLTVSLAPQLVRGPRRSASGQMSEETEGARIVNDDG